MGCWLNQPREVWRFTWHDFDCSALSLERGESRADIGRTSEYCILISFGLVQRHDATQQSWMKSQE